MEVVASLPFSGNWPKTIDDLSARKDAEQSGEFAAWLFPAPLALASLNSAEISVEVRDSTEIAPAAVSDPALPISLPAQQDKPTENDPAAAAAGSQPEEKRLLASTQTASPQTGAVAVRSDSTIADDPMTPSEESEAARAARPEPSARRFEKHGDERPAAVSAGDRQIVWSLAFDSPDTLAPEAAPGPAALPETSASPENALPSSPDMAARAEQKSVSPDFRTARQAVPVQLSNENEPPALAGDPVKLDSSQQGQAVGRGQVTAWEQNLDQTISAIARDHEDGTIPRLKLGHELQAEKPANQEAPPARLSSVESMDLHQSETQQFSAGDRRDRPSAQREREAPIRPSADSAPIIGAQTLRGYETQEDVAPVSKWRPTLERLADDIVSHARWGQKEAVLQLDPPELGKIKIDLRLEDGKLHARIVAEGRESKQLIEAHLPELRQALAAGRLDGAEVRVSQGSWNGLAGDFFESFHHLPQGRQESGWHAHASPSTSPEPERAKNRQAPVREAGRVSMWA